MREEQVLYLIIGSVMAAAVALAWLGLRRRPPDSPTRNPALLRQLALSAIYSKLNDRHDRSLCGYDSLDDVAVVRAGFHDLWEIPRDNPKPHVRQLLDSMHGHGHRMDREMLECTVRRAMHFHPQSAFDSARMRGLAEKALLAWDVVRYADVVRNAFYVGYLPRKETLHHLRQAYALTVGRYDSWADFGDSFLLAKRSFDAQLSPSYLARVTPVARIERAIRELADDPQSSWNRLR